MKHVRYAGIGSRETPPDQIQRMIDIAQQLAVHKWILRSGGAQGADQAFMHGAARRAEVFLPWPSYERQQVHACAPARVGTHVQDDAIEYSRTLHPAPEHLKDAVARLHGRNVHIMLGQDIHDPQPVQVVICWTPHGRVTGGTGMALRVAEKLEIPVINLAVDERPVDEMVQQLTTQYQLP